LPEGVQSQVEALSLDQLGVLSEALLNFNSIDDLNHGLAANE
jgi:Domain of unknown function (DUF4351)